MAALAVQPTTFFFESALEQLKGRFPESALSRLRSTLKAYRSWVAEPAFRSATPDEGVTHVLGAVGPAVQFKAEFIAALESVPDGLELFVRAMTEEVDLAAEAVNGPDELAEAASLLQRAQRVLLRFIGFHPRSDSFDSEVGVDRLAACLTDGFHADNLLTVGFMAMDGESGVVPADLVRALARAALVHSRSYFESVRQLVSEVSPPPGGELSKTSSLEDLLALPPVDGPARSVEELDEAVASIFSSSSLSSSTPTSSSG